MNGIGNMKKGIVIKSNEQYHVKKHMKTFRMLNRMISHDKEDTLNFVSLEELPEHYDFFAQNGMRKLAESDETHKLVYGFTHRDGRPILIKEEPSIRPLGKGWIKLAWNSIFMDEGLFPYDPSYDRWKQLSNKHNIVTHDWKRRGDAVLFTLQCPMDSALNRLVHNGLDYKDYIMDKIKQTRSMTDRPIVIRPHPLYLGAKEYIQDKMTGVELSEGRSLYEDLDRAWCMITYNSTSCVEASLYGTPTIVLDPSAVSTSVSQTDLEQIEDPWDPDRTEWCRRIAFHQWQVCELEDGYVWRLLKKLIWKS
jgi:hypothetical protein